MNATTILCIMLLSLYLVLAVFWIVRSIIDTIDDRKREKRNAALEAECEARNAKWEAECHSSLNENVPFEKLSTTKPE